MIAMTVLMKSHHHLFRVTARRRRSSPARMKWRVFHATPRCRARTQSSRTTASAEPGCSPDGELIRDLVPSTSSLRANQSDDRPVGAKRGARVVERERPRVRTERRRRRLVEFVTVVAVIVLALAMWFGVVTLLK